MQKNSFNPDLMTSLMLKELSVGSRQGITIEIFKHFQSSLDKGLDNVFRFTARVVSIEVIQEAATKKIQQLTDDAQLEDDHLMVHEQNGMYYIDESFFPHYANEDGVFKSLDAVEKAIEFWFKTIQIVMQTEPSN